MNWPIFHWMKNTLLFTYRSNILVRLLTLKISRPFLPQKSENVRPILVTLLKMRPHYSQSSRKNATPSSDTSQLASKKEVPPQARHPFCLAAGPVSCTLKKWTYTLSYYIKPGFTFINKRSNYKDVDVLSKNKLIFSPRRNHDFPFTTKQETDFESIICQTLRATLNPLSHKSGHENNGHDHTRRICLIFYILSTSLHYFYSKWIEATNENFNFDLKV